MLVNLEENKQREKEHRSKARHADLVLDKEVKKEVDEAYNAQLKFKLKAHEQGPGEGSSAAPDSPDHSDSSNSSIWESCDDDKTESDNDIDKKDNDDDSDKDSNASKDQIEGFGILVHDNEPKQRQIELQPHSPSVTITSQEDNQTLTVVPFLDTIPEVQEDPPVDQVTNSPPATTTNIPTIKLTHPEAIEDSVQANVINMVKNQLSMERILMMNSVERMLIGPSNQDNITKADLEGPAFELLKNRFKNSVELEYNMEQLGYGNDGMKDRAWTKKNKERKRSMLEKIRKTLKERRRIRRIDCFVRGRRNEPDYILLVRPE
ncbi:hypothetical protein Tco_1085976 [Tanacetum coccineum]